MQIFNKIMPLKSFLSIKRKANLKIGLIPTMGALHEGHLILIRNSLSICDVTVVSIFVNPTQFNNAEDFKKYPKTLSEDIELLENEGVDLLFNPDNSEMYQQPSQLNFQFERIGSILEGKFRPGHFSGVGLVVSKLFNIIRPHVAFFGQKDLQQVAVIKKLNEELLFGLEIQTIATVREANGLALSSRNKRLSKSHKALAPILYKTMQEAKTKLLSGESIEKTISSSKKSILSQGSSIKLEYFEIVDSNELTPVKEISEHKEISICVAAHFGEVRLIDNLFLFSR
jgi:pantoate--beta-alanine ligase